LGATTLPRPGLLQRRIDAAASDMLGGKGVPNVDFARPHGVQALLPPDSLSWRLFKNPLPLFIGGITAVILELALPGVRDGVWQHSSFRTDALTRLRRTGLAAMVTVYAPADQARAMISGVVRTHGHVTGTTDEGMPYAANDPVLLDWVQATASYGFIQAYHAFVSPFDDAEYDQLLAEAVPGARLYGAVGSPASRADLDALFERMRPELVGHPIVAEFLDIMGQVPAFPAPFHPFQRMLIRAAIDLVPDWLRARLDLGKNWALRPWERTLVGAACRLADRVVIRSSPAVQSCRRLGLPDDYLYRRS
jgi:uncharacterized protein (DUF2236 family)